MDRTRIGDRPLAAVRDHYRKYLFDELLPFWDRHGIDHERGGFLCGLDHDGTLVSDAKNMWYQGRGLWAWSAVARAFDHAPSLEVARQTKDFLLRHGRDDEGWWVAGLSADGQVTAPASQRGYESLFVAEGLTAWAAAAGDAQALDLAVASLERVVELFADSQRDVDEGYVPLCYPGMRLLGGNMVLILTLTQMQAQRPDDPRLKALSERFVTEVMERFWNPRYELLNEALTVDLTRPDDANEDFCYLGHGIETLWMIMDEALRRGDGDLFERAAARFRRSVEVAWDGVYGGLFRALKVRDHAFTLDKVLWLQEEGLIGCLLLMEHTDDPWAWRWFARLFEWIESHCRLAPHGYPLYQTAGDRQMTFEPHVQRKENYHHLRCVLRCLTGLDRLAARDGAPSGAWS